MYSIHGTIFLLRQNTIRIKRYFNFQIPDGIQMLEQKSKYRNKFIRTVNARQATVYDRIKEIKEVGGLHSIHIMDAQHVKLMTRLAQKAQPHPKINNIWSIQPRRNHRMNHLSCLTRFGVASQPHRNVGVLWNDHQKTTNVKNLHQNSYTIPHAFYVRYETM